ncbi:4-hydroxy-4-methyl-2-oxoglutarate aldolase [Symmachiella macrocystis]|uniref:Putative 4-hydroxy-4-methyl-2-oxoglutarate aldolase n=1 Tax=Symmachiella macrocystis TaxID=2527985 RepID=A0A5C6BBA0_9PLAN|nr:RraA family protein [Symmachiella macrocystis]TWU08952.1 4-hydroxy-4-methyl-2-oxoglutarate aldolase [Symmachiella macrocystis]
MNSVTESPQSPNLAELARFDTPTICNAIELFDVRSPTAGYMDRRIAACFPDLPAMVGYAATATFRSAEPSRRREGDPHPAVQLLEILAGHSTPTIVVFQDLDDPPAGATFGDGMCLTYKTFGAVGLITSGAARDLDNVRALDFPCFSHGAVCGHGHCHIESVDVPVHVGGVTIHPGDLLHGDHNGVTTIPLEIAHLVPYACSEYLKHEAVVLDPLRGGNTDISDHQQAIAEMGQSLSKLKADLVRMR